MKLYSVCLFSECVGYVREKNKTQALIKAANMFGFMSLDEYIYAYPGHYTEESEIVSRIKRTTDYFYLDMHGTFKDNNFILWVHDTNSEDCVKDLVQCTKNFDSTYRKKFGWYDRTLATLTIRYLKRSASRYCKQVGLDEKDMWYCEDWKDEKEA